jgi:NADPH:quinone reductase-like Zn-dependent oxidoreductase
LFFKVAVHAADSVTTERERKTLDGLLGTPLDLGAILFQKWLASLLSGRGIQLSTESETTILFVKLMLESLKPGGRCAVIVSEGSSPGIKTAPVLCAARCSTNVTLRPLSACRKAPQDKRKKNNTRRAMKFPPKEKMKK